MLFRRRVGVVTLLTVFATASAGASCLDFGDLGGGSTGNDGGNDTGTSETSLNLGDGAIGEIDSGRPEPSIKLAAGRQSMCAIQGGVVKCWGDDLFGELGVGTIDGAEGPHPMPVTVKLPFTPTMISGGGWHICASDGTHTACWGDDGDLELGQSPNADAGCVSSSCPLPISVDLGSINSFALGYYFTCFTPAAGGLKCFGSNQDGQVGPLSVGANITSPQAIALTNVAEVSAGAFSVCARQDVGSVWCWGDNQFVELGVETTDGGPDAAGEDMNPHPNPSQVPGTTARQLSMGFYSSCVTLSDNTVTCWGRDNYGSSVPTGQLGHDPTTDPLCVGSYNCDPTPTPVSALTNVREVTAGETAACAVRIDDSVVCWGDERSGLLNSAPNVAPGGGGDDPYNFTPQVMPGLTNVAHVVMGELYACAVTWDDHVLCWGDNTYGELGVPLVDGGPGFSLTPVTPQGF